MVADKPAFIGSPEHAFLKKHAKKKMIFVAHNAKFDLAMMKKEGITYRSHICTLKVTRHLDVKGKLDCHKLQYLRYLYGMEIEAEAHDAWGDILVLELLFWKLVKKMCKDNGYGEAEAIAEMMEISSKPSIIRKWHFGKHRDSMIEDTLATDRGYLEWMLGTKKTENKPDDEDLIYTLETLLAR
jgi:DNA polymerase III epsilon subunit-like protein